MTPVAAMVLEVCRNSPYLIVKLLTGVVALLPHVSDVAPMDHL